MLERVDEQPKVVGMLSTSVGFHKVIVSQHQIAPIQTIVVHIKRYFQLEQRWLMGGTFVEGRVSNQALCCAIDPSKLVSWGESQWLSDIVNMLYLSLWSGVG